MTIRDLGLTIGLNSLMQLILDELKLRNTVMPYIFEAVRSFSGRASQFPNQEFCSQATSYYHKLY